MAWARCKAHFARRAGIFQVDGITVKGSINVKSIPTSLRYDPTVDESHLFVIRAIDAFNLSADLDIHLTAFMNIPPTLVVDVIQPNGRGPFERLIDASESFDGDERFGGRIVEYEYRFLGIIRNIEAPTQTVIFPSAGTYQVRVRAKDNDNVWTDILTIPIQVN